MKKIFVTGAAGFIGSNLIDRLLDLKYQVVGYDNLSTGKIKFLENALKNSNFSLIQGDNLEEAESKFIDNFGDFEFSVKEINNFLKAIIPNNDILEYILKILGQSLIGEPPANFYIFSGADGANGKTTLINFIEKS